MKKLKIIFLDFDGVLNSQDWYNRRENQNLSHFDDWGETFDPIAVDNLRKLIEQTGAKIVVTSTWRHGSGPCKFEGNITHEVSGLDYIKAMWAARNLPGEVLDITPYFFIEKGSNLELDSRTVKINNISVPRGVEIDAWLNANNFIHWRWNNPKLDEELDKCPIENYVIIDDDADMLIEHNDRMCQTDSLTGGFNDKCLARAIQILNTPIQFGFSPWKPK